MFSEMLAVVPARSGSKGVPNKNIRLLAGKPLIQYTIDAASPLVDRYTLVVDSDSQGYLDLVSGQNIETNLRPGHIAEDRSKMVDVLKNLLNVMESKGRYFKSIMILQATCPFRRTSHIAEALEAWDARATSSLISVTRMEDYHPARMYEFKNRALQPLLGKSLESENRQELPDVFHRNGLIYITTVDNIRNGVIVGDQPSFIEIGRQFSINIDDEFDWSLAEAIMTGTAGDR